MRKSHLKDNILELRSFTSTRAHFLDHETKIQRMCCFPSVLELQVYNNIWVLKLEKKKVRLDALHFPKDISAGKPKLKNS